MRISWVDNLKWLWIILIVAWHSLFSEWNLFFWYIFCFHVALFFFLSGYLFNEEKHNNFKKFLFEKFKRLIIPYISFNLIFIIYERLIEKVPHNLLSVLKWMFYWTWLKWNKEIFLLNVSTWFLLSLFLVSIFYFFINKFIKNKLHRLIFLFLLSIIIYYESKIFINIKLPFSIEPSIMASFFYWIWHIYKEKITNFVEKINYKYILYLPGLILLNILFLNWTNFSMNEYGDNYFNFLISSITWITTWIIIAKIIPQNRILNFLWINSIIILWMEFLKARILWFIAKFSYWYIIYERSIESWLIQLLWTIIIMFPIIFIINKFMPFILWDFKNIKYVKNN